MLHRSYLTSKNNHKIYLSIHVNTHKDMFNTTITFYMYEFNVYRALNILTCTWNISFSSQLKIVKLSNLNETPRFRHSLILPHQKTLLKQVFQGDLVPPTWDGITCHWDYGHGKGCWLYALYIDFLELMGSKQKYPKDTKENFCVLV